jgi:hypothetical protein
MDGICKGCHGLFRRYVGKNMQADVFVYLMRATVSLLNVFPFYVINYEMIEYMPPMDKYLYKWLFNAFLIVNLISYWTASLLKPIKIPQVSLILVAYILNLI